MTAEIDGTGIFQSQASFDKQQGEFEGNAVMLIFLFQLRAVMASQYIAEVCFGKASLYVFVSRHAVVVEYGDGH